MRRDGADRSVKNASARVSWIRDKLQLLAIAAVILVVVCVVPLAGVDVTALGRQMFIIAPLLVVAYVSRRRLRIPRALILFAVWAVTHVVVCSGYLPRERSALPLTPLVLLDVYGVSFALALLGRRSGSE